MANLFDEVTENIETLNAKVADPQFTVALDKFGDLSELIPGFSGARGDVADLIAELRDEIGELDLSFVTILTKPPISVPTDQVETVVDFMELATSLMKLSTLIAGQIDNQEAENRINAAVAKLGELTDLVDTVNGFSEGVQDELEEALTTIEGPIRG